MDLALLQSRSLFMYGNPKRKEKTYRNQLYVSLGQHEFNNFCNLNRLILEKGSSTPVLANHKKIILPLKRAFLGESQRLVRRLSNQISILRLETHFFFLTYVQLKVMLHYRIHSFLRTELLVRNSFQSEVFI